MLPLFLRVFAIWKRTFLSAFAERDNWMALDKLVDAFCKLGNEFVKISLSIRIISAEEQFGDLKS